MVDRSFDLRLRKGCFRTFKSERGASLLDSAIIIGLVAVASMTAVLGAGIQTGDKFCESAGIVSVAGSGVMDASNSEKLMLMKRSDGSYGCRRVSECAGAPAGSYCDFEDPDSLI